MLDRAYVAAMLATKKRLYRRAFPALTKREARRAAQQPVEAISPVRGITRASSRAWL
ncbi:MAG: hypothetical protein OJF49_004301 [Ktedonobacterales bacterium]|nr:MAG: hypothetical protein OJF49_004301 [Ktedonobacterales bacterium]